MSCPNTTKSPVSLVDIPDLPLKHILSYVGFKSLQSLRLVSKPICRFINTEKPSVQIDDLHIKVTKHSVELRLKSCGLNSDLEIHKHETGADVSSGHKIRYYEGMNYLNCSINMLKYIINTQTAHAIKTLEYSDKGNSEFSKMFQKFLTDQKIILKVREFSLEGNEDQAVQLLPFLDSNVLDTLIFCCAWETNSNDNLMQLDQWKKAKSLYSTHKVFRVPIQNFGHFETVKINMHRLTEQDLVYLKEKYSQSTVFSSAIIYCDVPASPARVFGEPTGENKWVFRCSNSIHALVFIINSGSVFCCRTLFSNTPLSVF